MKFYDSGIIYQIIVAALFTFMMALIFNMFK
jgi:hypothetical protein